MIDGIQIEQVDWVLKNRYPTRKKSTNLSISDFPVELKQKLGKNFNFHLLRYSLISKTEE